MTACYEGNVNAAKVLLADWKDMHNLSKSLVYSAYYAIQGGQISTLKIVCKHEKFTAAHAHSTGPEGVSLLGAAIQKNRLDLITYLLDDVQINPTKQCWNGGGNGLHACALWGTTEAIQLLIRHPKVVPVMYERKNQRGETPLVTAVAAHNYGACQELIKRGALTTGTGRMWCAAFLLSACLTQHVKGKTVMPKAMVWRGKKVRGMRVAKRRATQLCRSAASNIVIFSHPALCFCHSSLCSAWKTTPTSMISPLTRAP